MERIPWKEYLGIQLRNIFGFISMIFILLITINLSGIIVGDEADVITFSSQINLFLILSSALLFIFVLIAFSKAVLIDHKREFGIRSWKSIRAIVTIILTSSFISLVFILLDVSLIEVYLMLAPVYSIWSVPNIFGIQNGLLSNIPSTTDQIAYVEIRSSIFMGLLGLIFIFPIAMFTTILTRFGHKSIQERREKKKNYYWGRILLLFIGIPLIELVLLFLFAGVSNISNIFGNLVLLIMGFGVIIWIGSILLIFINILRLMTVFAYTNFLFIFPFIFLFYIVPGLLWGIWDLIIIIIGLDTTSNTIYQSPPTTNFSINPEITNFSELAYLEIIRFYIQTVNLNLRDIFRIIELDFVFIIGLSACVIGFAEGYSILAIFRSITTGVSVAKSGRIAKRSAPRMVVISSRLIYLFAWGSLLWDKLLVILDTLTDKLSISIPVPKFPQMFEILYTFSEGLLIYGDFFAVVTILIVPFYFIIASSFKFLSVGLVLDKTEEDVPTYILLISSAYILIVITILADISLLNTFQGENRNLLPLANGVILDLVQFSTNIFDILESIAFYIGTIISVSLGIRNLISQDKEEDTNKR